MDLARSARFCIALALLAAQPVMAQDHGDLAMQSHSRGPSASTASPYTGMAKRRVKALSDQQIAELKAGRGMGLALAAELNGYPGPVHVLEFADSLQLSDEQRTRTKALLKAMKAETVPIGERIIMEETALDRLFAEKRVTQASLEAATSRIGAAQGELRSAHLRYHLAMVLVLSPAQIARYAELRGYADSGHHGHGTQ
jgi:Spy/CpxP family protein refolding chaperone